MSVTVERARLINRHLSNLGVNIYLSCVRKKAKNGKVSIYGEWKQANDSCDSDYPNIITITETQVSKLIKPFNLDLKKLYNSNFKLVNSNKVEVKPIVEIPKSKPNNENKTVKPVAKAKNSLIIYGDNVVIDTNDKMPAEYGLTELDNLIPSNDGVTFTKNSNYPQQCQTRDYSLKGEQDKVIFQAKNFNPSFVVNEITHPADGTPIIDTNFIVYSGNSRTMTLQRVQKFGNYSTEYSNYLRKRISFFGFNETQLDKFKYPVLVRVIPVPKNCEFLSLAFQGNKGQKLDPVTLSLAISKQFSDDIVNSIANTFEEYELETFGEFFQNNEAQNKVYKLLLSKGIITKNTADDWYSNERFNESGQLLLKNSLLALILPTKPLLESVTSFTDTLGYSLPQLIQIKRLKGEWNLIPDIHRAIQLEVRRRRNNISADTAITQQSFTEELPSEKEILVYKLLLKNKPRILKRILSAYLETANNENKSNNMFGKQEPLDVLKEIVQGVDKKGLGDDCVNEYFEEFADDFDFEESQENIRLPNVRDVIRKRWTSKPLQLKRTGHLLPNLLDNAKVLIKGIQGSGKSTFALMLMDDLARNGKVLFISAEEKPGERIKERLIRNRITTSNIDILPTRDWFEIQHFMDLDDYKAIVIDSHNELINIKRNELSEFIKALNDKVVVIITRMSKNKKDILGPSGMAYDIDTEILLSNGVATTEKHRDGVSPRTMQVIKKDFSHLTQL